MTNASDAQVRPAQSPETAASLARRIDHTILKPEAGPADIDKLCDEALEHGFAAICVNPCWIPRAVARLHGSPVAIASVAGFPLGATTTAAKAFEAREAVEAGATEVDMVVNIGKLIAEDRAAVVDDIWQVVAASRRANPGALVKVILETAALSESQIILGCRCVAEAQADFVKTSTGFHAAGGATLQSVALLRKHTAPIRVKASGGIRDLAAAEAMLAAGADRLGMSAGVQVMRDFAKRRSGRGA